MEKIAAFTMGDSNDISTWSNVPFLFLKALQDNDKNLEMSDSVKLFDKCQKLLEENDGRMLICGDEMSAYDLEYVSDELSALKLLSI